MESTKSLWEKTVSVPSYPSFAGDSHTDVLIIGGGITGILTAYMLAEKGVRCTVLEAASLFSGQTGRTTAKITSQHGLIYEKMIRTHGFATARAYAEASEAAIAEYRRIANEKSIECEMETLPAYVYSTDREALKKETESAIALGLPASFITETELPFSAAGAVRFEKQAQFHPLKQAAERFFPGARILCQWSAQDCMTPDHIPYIGRFSKETPNTYVATGFCKWGMTSAMAAAKLLCDLIRRKPNRYASIFPHPASLSELPPSSRTVYRPPEASQSRLFIYRTGTLAQFRPDTAELCKSAGINAAFIGKFCRMEKPSCMLSR